MCDFFIIFGLLLPPVPERKVIYSLIVIKKLSAAEVPYKYLLRPNKTFEEKV